jgi:hypothetical protein
MAVQISPRRGKALWLVKVHLLRCPGQGVFEIVLLLHSLGRQAFEIVCGLPLKNSPIIQPASRLNGLVHSLADAVGSTRLDHLVKIGETFRVNCGGEFLALQHISYFRRCAIPCATDAFARAHFVKRLSLAAGRCQCPVQFVQLILQAAHLDLLGA